MQLLSLFAALVILGGASAGYVYFILKATSFQKTSTITEFHHQMERLLKRLTGRFNGGPKYMFYRAVLDDYVALSYAILSAIPKNVNEVNKSFVINMYARHIAAMKGSVELFIQEGKDITAYYDKLKASYVPIIRETQKNVESVMLAPLSYNEKLKKVSDILIDSMRRISRVFDEQLIG